MTFDPNVPNASQSPGLFPAQANTNFARIKTLINADHVFNDTASSTDGVHRQMQMVARAVPVSLAVGVNAICYTWIDSLGRAQLRFYNGVTDVQLTPPQELYPIRVAGATSLAAGASTTVYADPGFRWAGTGWAMLQNTIIYTFYNLLRSGSNRGVSIDTSTTGPVRPTFSFVGNDLVITNNDLAGQAVEWSLIINRIP